jgi:hypothetical protein
MALPFEARYKIGEVAYQKGMRATSRKNRVIEILKEYNVPFTEVGTGTNRFIVRQDGFALKIALDKEGIADNKQEWVMSGMLAPNVATAHDISKGGHLLVADYAPAFTSYQEMSIYGDQIRKILENWGSRFLLGDVGFNRVNYANWGMLGGKPVCIDYAYIFPASMDLFKCNCGCKRMKFVDDTYSAYKCTECGREYQDRELRCKISQDDRLKLFNSVEGLVMHNATEEHMVPEKYLPKNTDPDQPNPDLATINYVRTKQGLPSFWSGY